MVFFCRDSKRNEKELLAANFSKLFISGASEKMSRMKKKVGYTLKRGRNTLDSIVATYSRLCGSIASDKVTMETFREGTLELSLIRVCCVSCKREYERSILLITHVNTLF